MRVAVNGWFLGQETTGSGQYLHHLLDRLPCQRAGIDIDIDVLIPFASNLVSWRERWPSVRITPVDLLALPRSLQKVWWEQVAFPKAAGSLLPDVLWVPYWAAPHRQPAPVVVTVHDVVSLLLPAYRGGPRHRLYTRLVSRTARHAAAVITVSHASAADIVRQLNIPPHRVHVVHHGPNFEPQPIDVEALQAVRTKYSLPDRYFLYLGGFDVRKNVDTVIHAYRRYLDLGGSREVKLVLAGKLPDASTGVHYDPRPIVSHLELADHVRYLGWVEEKEKPALYALATAFVFPSLYEGFGMMALEAMAGGTPVITSDR